MGETQALQGDDAVRLASALMVKSSRVRDAAFVVRSGYTSATGSKHRESHP